MPPFGVPLGLVHVPPRSGVPPSRAYNDVGGEVLHNANGPPTPAFAAQLWITAGWLSAITSPVQPLLPHDPVSLSPKVFTDTPRPSPLMQSTPLSTLIVQQKVHGPVQKSPKLLPGSPSLFRSKKKPGPCGPMAVPAVPCTLLYQPQVPPLSPHSGGGAPGVNVAMSHPGPKLATTPWNQFALVVFHEFSVKQKVTVSPHA